MTQAEAESIIEESKDWLSHSRCLHCEAKGFLEGINSPEALRRKEVLELLNYIEAWANFSNGEPEAKKLIAKFKAEAKL